MSLHFSLNAGYEPHTILPDCIRGRELLNGDQAVRWAVDADDGCRRQLTPLELRFGLATAPNRDKPGIERQCTGKGSVTHRMIR
ncbi:MAG: hypothetical protein KAS81_05585 [Anaerolineales bacterium]|nr:hypothetical protein [Anaerolineales bacterium]